MHVTQSLLQPFQECAKWAREQNCHRNRDGDHASIQHKHLASPRLIWIRICCVLTWSPEVNTESRTQRHAPDVLPSI